MLKNNTFALKILPLFSVLALSGCAQLTPGPTPPPAASDAGATPVIAAPPLSVSTGPQNQMEPVQAQGPMVKGEYTSLWDVIRTGYSMDHHYNRGAVQYFIQSYSHNPTFLPNIINQARPYLYTIVTSIQAKDLPTELALLPIVESGFKPKAISYCGATGLWQLMRQTARDLNTGKESYWYNSRESVQESTEAALNYLKYLYNYFDHNWMLALAAYNAGPGTVQNAINRNQARGLPTDFWSLHLPVATQNYVPELLALAIIVNDPAAYHLTLPEIPNRPLVASAVIPQQMSLSQAAKFAGIDEQELKSLNPGFTRNVTPPVSTGSYSLSLPIANVNTFVQNCAANPGVTGLVRYASATEGHHVGSYRVKRGDSLISVSRFTGTSIAELRRYNHLKNHGIHVGQVLHYPIDETAAYHFVTYHVKRGDSLSSIARRHHVTTFDLMQWNDLKAGARLHVGERLVIRQKTQYD